jgi:serine phosphatase RsbU (regulator of sigma subunit)/PAS domain-containing protein
VWGDEVTEQTPAAQRPLRVPLRVVVNAGGELDPDDLAGVLEAMPAAFFFLDRQWRFRYVNLEMDRLLHLPREELLGRSIWDIYPLMVGSRFERAYREAVASGKPVAFEAPYSGELPGWYEVRAWPRPDGLAVYFLDVTARHTAEEAARRGAARLDLLARVNAELSGALDSVSALGRLARLVVPTLTDACIVTVVDRDGRARDVGSWHADPAKRQLMARYAQIRLETLPPASPVALALTEGTPVTEPVADVLALMRPGPARDLLEKLGPARAGVLPLPADDRTVGVLTLYHDAERVVGPQDVETAREVAAQAGRAIDRVHRQSKQAQLAEGLQRSLLTEPPGIPHAEVVVRYVPAAEAARVGGDWYDAFLQRDGTPMIVIGDVVGHDTAAAAMMGQLRGLLRGIAHHSGAGPAAVLQGLDEAIASMHTGALATAAVARFEGLSEDGSARMRWANAGHPPPFLLTPDRRVTVLGGPLGDLMLGVDPTAERVESVLDVAPGSVVLLYTDGLIERRGSSLDDGLDRLRGCLQELAGRPLDELCDMVLEHLLQGTPEDDVALVALTVRPDVCPR